MKWQRRRVLLLIISVCLVAATSSSRGASATPAPGDRVHGAAGPNQVLRLPPSSVQDADFTGLYAYTTPGAPPRWVRIQQSGNVVYGTIDINSSFEMCARERLDGNVSGNNVVFSASLATTSCPCQGQGASITFLGTKDVNGDVSGPWANSCSSSGNWSACYNSTAFGSQSVCGSLPDNEPPAAFSAVPVWPRWGAALTGLGLLLVALATLRSYRSRGFGRSLGA